MDSKLILLLLFAALSVCLNSVVADSEKDRLFEEWVERIRPAMFSKMGEPKRKVADKVTKERKHKSLPSKYFDRSLSPLDVARMFIKEHDDDVIKKIGEVLFKDRTTSGDVNSGQITCQDTSQCPPPSRRRDKKALYERLVDSLRKNPDSCEPCELSFGSLQESACEGDWEPFRDDLIGLCEFIIFPLLDVDPVMCNGTLSLQGRHLYCILQATSPRDMCESLNSCYPAGGSTRDISERTPWMVKDKLQEKAKARKQKKKTRQRRQNGTLRVVQLTDIHVQPKYAIGSPAECKAAVCCQEDSLAIDGSTLTRPWGEYQCNLPQRTMIKFLEKVNEFSPDFVLYSGDNPPHTMWDETLESQLDCSRLVVGDMKNIFPPGLRVYPNIGNHEMYPTNLYSKLMPETSQMNIQFAAMWSELAGLDDTANATFANMSYYTVLHQPGLRILAINTNYDWYPLNFYNTLNKEDTYNENHKLFVENTLELARDNNEKVIIVGHHPIGGSASTIRNTRWWEHMMNLYGDVIVLHISGHTHMDHQHLVVDPDTDEAKTVNLVSPVVTTLMYQNPSMRVFDLDSVTYELEEMTTHIFEIDLQHPEDDPNIRLNYDPKIEYNMTDLSPASWQDLVLRFLDDDILFQTWYQHRNADVDRGPCFLDNYCDESCKISEICGIWFAAADDKAACIDNWGTAPPTAETDVNGASPGAKAMTLLFMTVLSLLTLGHISFG